MTTTTTEPTHPRPRVRFSDEKSSTSTHLLPASCGLIVNNTGLHYNASSWPSPHVLAPSRWLAREVNAYDPLAAAAVVDNITTTATITKDSEARNQKSTGLKTFTPRHRRGTFFTFSEGPRACLGKRFAMAEFVAFFAGLLRRHRLRLREGERETGAVEREYRLKSAGSPITLAPPGDVGLVLVPR